MAKGNKAHIDQIYAMDSLRSKISYFSSMVGTYAPAIRSRADAVLLQAVADEKELGTLLSKAESQLEAAKRAHVSCLERQARDKDNLISCDREAMMIEQYEQKVDRISEACKKAKGLLNDLQLDCGSLDSILGTFVGQVGRECDGASSELGSLIDKAHQYLAVKMPTTNSIQVERSSLKIASAVNEVSGSTYESVSGISFGMTPKEVKHAFLVPHILSEKYIIENRKISSIVLNIAGQQLMKFFPEADNKVSVSFTEDPDMEIFEDMEYIVKENGFHFISSWANNKNKTCFLEQGFVVREGTVTNGGCVVEKIIVENYD